ncbi:MAG TPA: PaaI family thioesterase [Acidimicrobiales bacterium]|nr:PaaI family thioesterase [Acidimicrobiales bacterium]
MSDWAEAVKNASSREVTPQREAARRVGQAMRELIDQTVATSAPVEALEGVAEVLEALCRTIAKYPQGRLYEGFAESGPAGDPYAFFDNSPIIGVANPLAPPIHMTIEDGPDGPVVVGEARYGGAYEGPPGCVHGGYVAAAFDEVLGMTQSITGKPGMTGTLTIRYQRPTPLRADLRFEGRVDRVEGRKIFTVGRSYANGELTCEAEAVFITVDFAKIAALYANRPR